VGQEADVEITQSVEFRHLMLSVNMKNIWRGSERIISITALELVDHVDVVEIEDNTTVNIGLGSTSRIRIEHFPLTNMRDCVRVDTSHGWQMCVGITVVDRAIIEVVVADAVDVDMVVDSGNVKFHSWNMYRRKDKQRHNKALKCSINVAVMLELDSVVVVTEADQTADFLPRCRCGWCREFSSCCFLSCIVFSGRRRLEVVY
jgi:hypothetical protein